MMRCCMLLLLVVAVGLSIVAAQPQPQLMSATMIEESPPQDLEEPQAMATMVEESPTQELEEPQVMATMIEESPPQELEEPQVMTTMFEDSSFQEFDPIIAQSGIAEAECPKIPGCCEEDCCGSGTAYSSPFCLPAPGEPGFTGVYSDTFVRGCVPRDCCESDCCGEGTIYDPSIASCIPE